MQILPEQKTENHNLKVFKNFWTAQCSSELWVWQLDQHYCLGKEPVNHGSEGVGRAAVPEAGGSLSGCCNEEF